MMVEIILIALYSKQKKIMLLLTKESTNCKPRANLLSLPNFNDEMEESGMVFILFGEEASPELVFQILSSH